MSNIRTIYFATYYKFNNNYVQFILYDTKNILIRYEKNIPHFCNKLNNKDLVLLRAELILDQLTITEILDIVDENVKWTNKKYKYKKQMLELNEKKISKYGRKIGYDKKSLEFHTLKHPICDSHNKDWEILGIDYSKTYQIIKDKYEELSKNHVYNNRNKDWKFNVINKSINYIDEKNNLLVALNFNENNNNCVITTLHFKDNYKKYQTIQEELYNQAYLYTVNLLNSIKQENESMKVIYDENIQEIKNTISQMKRLKTRYFKDNPIDFYYSDLYDFDIMFESFILLKFCNELEPFDECNKLKEEYITFMIDCYGNDDLCEKEKYEFEKALRSVFEMYIDDKLYKEYNS